MTVDEIYFQCARAIVRSDLWNPDKRVDPKSLPTPGQILATLNEAGMTGYDAGIWIGLLAPAGTPPAIIEKLSVAANDALNIEAVRSALKQQGTDPVGGTPKEFSDFISADIEKWVAVLASSSSRK